MELLKTMTLVIMHIKILSSYVLLKEPVRELGMLIIFECHLCHETFILGPNSYSASNKIFENHIEILPRPQKN
ncbi:hypothetical protein ACJX0J_012876, partial [Zea mays]